MVSSSYAHDITPYIYGEEFHDIIKILESNVNKLFKWFRQNGLLANSTKSHFQTSPYERPLKIVKFLRRTLGGFD